MAPVSQRSEIAANLLDSPSAAAARDVGDICGIFLIILPDIHRKLEKLSRLISAEIEIDALCLTNHFSAAY